MRCSDTEGEVTIKPLGQSSESSHLRALGQTGETVWEREIIVSDGLIQVREADGSLRRLSFSPEGRQPDLTRFFYQGRVRSVESVGGVGGRVEGNQSEGAVVAPMNGQVVKVAVNVGDSVNSGDIVLILEAMKMENEVTAPIAGRLVDLSVTPGQSVSPGQPLFSIEAVE